MIPHDKLLNILYKVVDPVLKGRTRDYIMDGMGCTSWNPVLGMYLMVMSEKEV